MATSELGASKMKSQSPHCPPPTFTEVLVPGDPQVKWKRKVFRRWPVVVRIERNGRLRDRRSVHSEWEMPTDALVTFYRGRGLKTCSLDDESEHWFAARLRRRGGRGAVRGPTRLRRPDS